MQPQEITITYRPRGAALALLACRDGEVCLDGPAGTGKTFGILQKVHMALMKYPGARALMLRKTHASLTASVLVTYTQKVLHPLDRVKFYGGSAKEPPAFRYPNGSVWVVGGMDKADKVLSTDYDIIDYHEAIEANLNDMEVLTTRLRNGKIPYQQLIMDTNPGPPNHWLNKRMQDGKMRRISSRHEDNPILYTDDGKLTPFGEMYIDKLDALTGVRKLRLRRGIWAAAEGIVYEDTWDQEINVIPNFDIPGSWPRYLSIDFGYTNPFVCQWWAADPDGRLYLYREIYMTKRLVTQHAQTIIDVSGWQDVKEPLPYEIVTDHDAEDRATLEDYFRGKGYNLSTTAAVKNVSAGIQAVSNRLIKQPDGKPRLMMMEDTLVDRDQSLADDGLPYCTAQEVESYIWNTGKDAPVKKFDHGMDTMRYMVARFDLEPGDVTYMQNPWR
jgi:PBSX family phage terminase large subunit